MNPEHLACAVRHLHVLSVGQVTHDRYGSEIVAGGCAFFGARCAHALGARVCLLTSFGDDFARQADLDGIDVHAVRGGTTTVFTNIYPPNTPRVQKVESVSRPIGPDDLPDGWEHPDVLFLAPVFGEISPGDPWFSRVNARLRTVCIQGFLKTADSATGIVGPGTPLASGPFFSNADAFFLSEEDITCFGGPGLIDFLRPRAHCVFITRGSDGCDILTPEGFFHVGIYATHAVDPTGAGDTFAAACTLALAAGADPVQSARLGAAAASVVVEFEGSRHMSRIAAAWSRMEMVPDR